jgi:lysine decarboxylase
MSPRNAVFSQSERIRVSVSCGRVAAGPVTPYPPGIPVIMPGETVDSEVTEILIKNKINYIDVIL